MSFTLKFVRKLDTITKIHKNTKNWRKRVREEPSGFTLLELTVVILIIGIVTAVGVPRLFKGLESTKSRKLLSDIVMFFRQTRMAALSNSETIRVLVKLQEGIFEADNDKTFSIPDDSSISISVEDEHLYVDLDETNFTFYPNGMGSGAKLIISSESDKIATIFLDPLTGVANYSMEFELE